MTRRIRDLKGAADTILAAARSRGRAKIGELDSLRSLLITALKVLQQASEFEVPVKAPLEGDEQPLPIKIQKRAPGEWVVRKPGGALFSEYRMRWIPETSEMTDSDRAATRYTLDAALDVARIAALFLTEEARRGERRRDMARRAADRLQQMSITPEELKQVDPDAAPQGVCVSCWALHTLRGVTLGLPHNECSLILEHR